MRLIQIYLTSGKVGYINPESIICGYFSGLDVRIGMADGNAFDVDESEFARLKYEIEKPEIEHRAMLQKLFDLFALRVAPPIQSEDIKMTEGFSTPPGIGGEKS